MYAVGQVFVPLWLYHDETYDPSLFHPTELFHQ
jgi:hypothetical protein